MDRAEFGAYATLLRRAEADADFDLRRLVEDFIAIGTRSARHKGILGRRTYELLRARTPRTDPLMGEFLSVFTAADTAYPFVKYSERLDGLSHAASFRTSLSLRTRRLRLAGPKSCPEWILQDKRIGYRFAEVLGVRHPHHRANLGLADLDCAPATVIKPRNAGGAKGVYMIFEPDRILDVRQGEIFAGAEEMFRRLREDHAQGRFKTPRFIREEMIRDDSAPDGMTTDWKFYCFYGRIELIGSIRRHPVHSETWLTPGLEPAERGFGKDLPTHPVAALPEGMADQVRAISRQIPAPFVRIDMLSSDSGHALGEFTARPGTFHLYNRIWDRRLGDAFLDAEYRLERDLLKGKVFTAWRALRKMDRIAGPEHDIAVPMTGRQANKGIRKFFSRP